MFVAQHLREENIAEYLLYMWQVEDLLRAFHLDFDTVDTKYLSRFKDLSPEKRDELRRWYGNIIDMMRSEGVTEQGHLQICKNVISNLDDLHAQLMKSTKFPYYQAAYNQALPVIVALRARNGNHEESELDTCFNFMYGIMLLRLQQKPVSEETAKALQTLTTWIGTLSDYYKQDKQEPIEF